MINLPISILLLRLLWSALPCVSFSIHYHHQNLLLLRTRHRLLPIMSNNNDNNDNDTGKDKFPHRLPQHRLGTSHASLSDFHAATDNFVDQIQTVKEYSLVLVTEPSTRHILLGMKHRGFGQGFFNSFGGKLEPNETPLQCAQRELHEETGIDCSLQQLQSTAQLHFTFEDNPSTKMLVHVFRCNVQRIKEGDNTNKSEQENNNNTNANHTDDNTTQKQQNPTDDSVMTLDPTVIRGCEEITPEWRSDWYQIPLYQMFADDSLWLTNILDDTCHYIDGFFHFEPGGQDVNSIRHYFMNETKREKMPISSPSSSFVVQSSQNKRKTPNSNSNGHNKKKTPDSSSSSNSVQSKKKTPDDTTNNKNTKTMTLKHRLFQSLRQHQNCSSKEFEESWAFCNAVRNLFGNDSFDAVLDVAGGHGALGALFLILTSAQQSIIIDPAEGVGSIQPAWESYYSSTQHKKVLQFRHEDLRTGLPDALQKLIEHSNLKPHRILVVACHACQHLSEETLRGALSYGVAAAAMPCCQVDPTHSWKRLSKTLQLDMGLVMDLLLAGRCMPLLQTTKGPHYTIRMKLLDSKITPQNRMILCRPEESTQRQEQNKDAAHKRLEHIYLKAHENKRIKKQSLFPWNKIDTTSLALGVAMGAIITSLLVMVPPSVSRR